LPSPECIVSATNLRPVVGDQPQLELGVERKEILPHEPSGDGLSAGHGLDFRFVEVAVDVGFDGRDHADTPKDKGQHLLRRDAGR
jgi:hypothetical protein